MANCVNYNCTDDLNDQVLLNCDDDMLGGASAVIFLACDHTVTDPSVAAQITDAIAAGKAWKYTDVAVSITKATAVKITPPAGCATEKVINYERSGTYKDGNVNSTNILNYDVLFKGAPLGGMIIYECGASRVTWINAKIQFEGDRLLPESNKEIQMFDASFNWLQPEMPTIHALPVGIF